MQEDTDCLIQSCSGAWSVWKAIFRSCSVSEQEQAYPAIFNCHRLICESEVSQLVLVR